MYKKKKKTLLENVVMRQGAKHKTENLMKKLFKEGLRAHKNEDFLVQLKQAVIKSSEVLIEGKQTLKRGKRKQIAATNVLLVRERARYSNAWKTILNNKSSKVSAPFEKLAIGRIRSIAAANQHVTETEASDTSTKNPDKQLFKQSLKFRW